MLSALITPVVHKLLSSTIKDWFEFDEAVEDTRRKIDRMIGFTDPLPRGYAIKPAGTAGGATLQCIEPANLSLPIKAIYFHGGGYICGGLKTHAAFCARLSKILDGAVIFVDYRLAPEHPFPAAYDDCCAAYAAIASQNPNLIIAGDSAGGGIALAVTQFSATKKLSQPRALILFSPWLDMTLSGNTMQTNLLTDSMLSPEILTRMRGLYIGDHDWRDPRASPLHGELTGLPPTLIIASTTEVLRADSRRLKIEIDWLRGKVELLEYEDMPHVFVLLSILPVASRALREIPGFLAAIAKRPAA